MDVNAPVVYYYGMTWAGDDELEYAWVYGEREQVLIRMHSEAGPGRGRLLEIVAEAETEHAESVLVRALSSLSCKLSDDFFVPHTRGFPWREYRVP